jgi:hypothetical protein
VTTRAGDHFVAPPTSMYSMNRTSAPADFPYSTKSTSSSSFTPLMTTASILKRRTRGSCGGHAWCTREFVEAREGFEAVGAQRIERDGNPPKTRGGKRVDLIREQDPVGRQRQIVQPWLAGDHAHECGHVAPEQRFAAREAQAVGAEREEDVHERGDFLEVQDVLPRQPLVLGFGHAVFAAQVAPVGDRQPEVAEWAPQRVCDHVLRL